MASFSLSFIHFPSTPFNGDLTLFVQLKVLIWVVNFVSSVKVDKSSTVRFATANISRWYWPVDKIYSGCDLGVTAVAIKIKYLRESSPMRNVFGYCRRLMKYLTYSYDGTWYWVLILLRHFILSFDVWFSCFRVNCYLPSRYLCEENLYKVLIKLFQTF